MNCNQHRVSLANHPSRRQGRRVSITLAAILALSLSGVPTLTAAGEAQDRPDHYEAEVPETTAQAAAIALATMQSITAALAAKDFEAIHELTYTLEAAAKRLTNSLADNSEEGEALSHRIEIVHLASELADEAVLKPALPSLKASLDTVVSQLNL